MGFKIPPLGILQGRLTPSLDGSIQFFPKDNWQNEFYTARHIGFNCVEFLVKQGSWITNPLLKPNGILEVMSCLTRVPGLSIPSVHGFYESEPRYPFILRKLIRGSALLGVKTILISFFDQNVLNSPEAKRMAYRQLSLVMADCAVAGIRLGVEAELPALELMEFVRSFPKVGVYYDIGNMASMGVDVAQEIKLLDGLICGVHVKDRMAGYDKTVPLGEGCVDFEAAFAALHDIGYDGSFIIQGARVPGIDDIELNKRYYHFCKGLLEKTYTGGGR